MFYTINMLAIEVPELDQVISFREMIKSGFTNKKSTL